MNDKNFFGPLNPIDDRSNRWRSVVAAVLGLIIVAVVAAHRLGLPADLYEVSSLADNWTTLLASQQDFLQGGDVVVSSPVELPPPPALPTFVGDPVDISRMSLHGAVVKDVTSGALLFGYQEYTPRPIASLTKLMSALVLLEQIHDWTATTTVVADSGLEDAHMYAGDVYTLNMLWHTALIGSSNKAVMSLVDASGLSRDQFVLQMNTKARELGMQDSSFVDPTGLGEVNIATPSDIILLFQEAMRHDRIVQAMRQKEYRLYSHERDKEHHMWNTNWLLLGWIPHSFVDAPAGKTGYIPAAGYNFVTRIRDEQNHPVDVVVLGTESHEARFEESRDLAEQVLARYEWPTSSESYEF